MIFFTVLQQVVILLILVCIGYILAKAGALTEAGVKGMTELVLLLVTPCVIIKSFIRKFDMSTFKAILISFIAAAAVHIAFILIAHLIFRSKQEERRRVLRFGVVFSNCGFMSLPLQQALLGDTGVLYGASFIAIFNLFVWSYGILQMSGDKKYLSVKKMVFNPGIIGLTLGLIIFIFSVKLPLIIVEPIGYIAALNTPVPMIIIGYHLAQSNLLKALRDRSCWAAVLVRLVILPLIAFAGLWLCNIRGDLLVSIVIAASAPTAAITTMFAAKFSSETSLSVNIVSISTILSLISMPVIITLAQMSA